MTAQLRTMVGDYLRVRRSLGYKLVGTEHLLFAFVDYCLVPTSVEARN